MKKLNIFLLVSLLTALFSFNGCDEDDPVPADTHDDAYADVIVKKMNVAGVPKYKLMFFAGGADIQEEGSGVTFPDGNTFPLFSFWAGEGKLTYAGAPMANTRPGAGEYKFTLKFKDGYVKTVTDALEDVDVGLSTGLNVVHTEGSDEVTLSWNPIEGVDFYCVKLTELDMATTMPLFKKAMAPTTDTTLTFNTTTSAMPGWMRSPSELQAGTQYWVVVSGKRVENGKPVTGAGQDFQINSCSKQKITW